MKIVFATKNKGKVNEVVKIFRSKIVDVSQSTLTVELTGDESKINALIRLLNEYGIKEVVRTGICGLERGEKSIKEKDRLFS